LERLMMAVSLWSELEGLSRDLVVSQTEEEFITAHLASVPGASAASLSAGRVVLYQMYQEAKLRLDEKLAILNEKLLELESL